MSEQPGKTEPAGEGLEDDEMVRQVAEQTSSDLAVEESFERQRDGASSDRPAEEDPAGD